MMEMLRSGILGLYCVSMYNDLVLNIICILQQHGGVSRTEGRKSNQMWWQVSTCRGFKDSTVGLSNKLGVSMYILTNIRYRTTWGLSIKPVTESHQNFA